MNTLMDAHMAGIEDELDGLWERDGPDGKPWPLRHGEAPREVE